jgi:hypothetical protein
MRNYRLVSRWLIYHGVRMIGVGNYANKSRTLFCFAASVLLSVPVVRACEWSYTIWSIRSKPADPLFRFVRNGKAGYIDASGKVIIAASLPANDNAFGEFHEGLLAVKDDHGYRYMDRSGKVSFHSDAWLAFDFSEGFAPASQYAGFPNDKFPKWGFIDHAGGFAIAPQYQWVEPFSEGLARVSVSSEVGTTGYIDSRGQFVIPPRLTYGASFHEDRAAVIISGPCRITNGGSCQRAAFQPTEPRATYDCRYAFIDKRGEPVSDLRFDDAENFAEGLAPVRIGNQWGFVNRSGQISIPPRFQLAEPFSEGMAVVEEDGKMGFIDHAGNYVIRPQFESAESFSDGRAVVSKSDGPGIWNSRFIDKTGNSAFPGVFSAAAPFTYGLASVALDRKGTFAWINKSGRPVFTYVVRQTRRTGH